MARYLTDRADRRLRELVERENGRRGHNRRDSERPGAYPVLGKSTTSISANQRGTFRLLVDKPDNQSTSTQTRQAYALADIQPDQKCFLAWTIGEDSQGFWTAVPAASPAVNTTDCPFVIPNTLPQSLNLSIYSHVYNQQNNRPGTWKTDNESALQQTIVLSDNAPTFARGVTGQVNPPGTFTAENGCRRYATAIRDLPAPHTFSNGSKINALAIVADCQFGVDELGIFCRIDVNLEWGEKVGDPYTTGYFDSDSQPQNFLVIPPEDFAQPFRLIARRGQSDPFPLGQTINLTLDTAWGNTWDHNDPYNFDLRSVNADIPLPVPPPPAELLRLTSDNTSKSYAMFSGRIKRDGTSWKWIDDTSNEQSPKAADLGTITESSTQITVPYSQTFTKILGANISPSSEFASFGCLVGIDPGLSSAVLKFSLTEARATWMFTHNGTVWEASLLYASGISSYDAAPTSIAEAAGVITLTWPNNTFRGVANFFLMKGGFSIQNPVNTIQNGRTELGIYDTSNVIITSHANGDRFAVTRGRQHQAVAAPSALANIGSLAISVWGEI